MRYSRHNDPQTPDDLLELLKSDQDNTSQGARSCYEDYILELFRTKDAFDGWCQSNNIKCSPVFELSIHPTSEEALQASVLSKQKNVAFAEKQLDRSRNDLRAAKERLKAGVEPVPSPN